MKRYVLILMVLTLLSLPFMAGADDQTIPPEANWTPTPPASSTVNAKELMEVLRAYPKSSAARKEIQAHAKCSSAR